MNAQPPRYDDVADLYVGVVGEQLDDPGTPELLALTGDVSGLRLLDLACGHGRITRELARRGANVTGLDISPELLERGWAIERDAPLGVGYVLAGSAAARALGEASFDGATCSWGLTDIDDLDAACALIARVVRPGGFLIASLLHPCFPGWGAVPGSWPSGLGYFDEGWWRPDAPRSTIRRAVGSNHRTLSTYVNTLARHGLTLTETREPALPEGWLSDRPDAEPVPAFLVLRCRR